MNPKTYNLVWKLWKEIGENSKFINTFIWGDITEPDKYDSIQWPALIVTPISSEVFENTINHTFKVSVADLVNEDESNRNEVWSDSQKALTDIIKLLRYEDFSYQLVNNPVMNVFYEKWNDNVSGWVTDIIVEFDFDNSECNLSIDNFLTPGPTYEGAVDVGPQMYLDDLLDVVITGATNGQGLVYQDGVWINGTVSSSGGSSFSCEDLLGCEVFIELQGSVDNIDLSNYLPLSGGTISGQIKFTPSNTNTLFQTDISNDGEILIGMNVNSNYLQLRNGKSSEFKYSYIETYQDSIEMRTNDIFGGTDNGTILNGSGLKIYGLPAYYDGDYSSMFITHSLVTKGWVVSNFLTQSSLIGFLTASSLEGYLPLTGGIVSDSGNAVFIRSNTMYGDQLIRFSDDGILETGSYLGVDDYSQVNNGGVYVQLKAVQGGTSSEFWIYGNQAAEYISGDSLPINYGGDYSSQFVTHSLITKGYLQTQLTPVKKGSIWFSLDGNGADLVAGSSALISGLIVGGTITDWSLEGEEASGSMVVDVQRWNGSSYVSIVGAGNKPTITSTKFNSASVSGWTSTTLVEGDRIRFVLDSVSSFTKANINIYYNKE